MSGFDLDDDLGDAAERLERSLGNAAGMAQAGMEQRNYAFGLWKPRVSAKRRRS